MTLLEKAHTVKAPIKPVDTELEDLAIAWLKGDIRLAQAAKALNMGTGSGVYAGLAQGLRAAYHSGRLALSNKGSLA